MVILYQYIKPVIKNKSILLILKTLLFLLICTGCSENNREINIPVNILKDGDIVFRRGTGLTSQVVIRVDDKGIYSHLGIIKFIEGKCCVIHAVPGEQDFEGDKDRIKIEPINSFFSWNKSTSGAIMRLNNSESASRRAAEHAYSLYKKNILFDHDYDIKDSTKMYCTELIDYVYKNEKIDLPEGRISKIRLPGFNGEYLLPNDIADNKKLNVIYKY